jgi:hypothetical protein
VELAEAYTLVRADELYTLHERLALRTEKAQLAVAIEHAYMHAVLASSLAREITTVLTGVE